MKRREILHGIAALLLLPRLSQASSPEVVVVCHPSNAVGSLSRAQLDALFRAKSQDFPGGGRATPVNLPTTHPVRQAFDRAVLGLESDEIERFWIDSKIRSGVGAPRRLPGPAAISRYVATEPTGLGYLPIGDVGAGLRVVARVRDGRVIPP